MVCNKKTRVEWRDGLEARIEYVKFYVKVGARTSEVVQIAAKRHRRPCGGGHQSGRREFVVRCIH
jgi:hypothetical protein